MGSPPVSFKALCTIVDSAFPCLSAGEALYPASPINLGGREFRTWQQPRRRDREEQVISLNLPTRDHKSVSAADKAWPHSFACELDAMEPDTLRDLVEECINRHLPQDQLDILKVAERSERQVLRLFATTHRSKEGGE